MEVSNPAEGFIVGMGLMFSFGLGTVLPLFLIAKLTDFVWLKRWDVIYKISSVLMVIVGIYFVIRAIRF